MNRNGIALLSIISMLPRLQWWIGGKWAMSTPFSAASWMCISYSKSSQRGLHHGSPSKSGISKLGASPAGWCHTRMTPLRSRTGKASARAAGGIFFA